MPAAIHEQIAGRTATDEFTCTGLQPGGWRWRVADTGPAYATLHTVDTATPHEQFVALDATHLALDWKDPA